MKKIFFLGIGLLGIFNANAAVIDIIEGADGKFEIFSDGARYGGAPTRAAAEKVASKLGGQGNTINWKWFNRSTSTSGGAAFNPANALPAAQPQKALPGGTNTPGPTPQKALPPHTEPKQLPAPKNTPAPTPKPSPKVNGAGVAMGALGVVTGGISMYNSVADTQHKASWGDVAEGAMGGAMMAGGATAIVNAIPVGGQIAYGAAVAVGAVVGAMGAGAKMFSETDCDVDPVTGQYACCNISNLSNIDARRVNIGDEMFCDFPGVRTCMQGKNKFESNWFKARFLDDHWSDRCETKFCLGYDTPENGNWKIQRYGASEEKGKVCWKWECADDGMVRRGGKCVAADGADNNDVPYPIKDVVITANGIKAGDTCPADRLPQFATDGKYIKNGKNPDTGLDKFVCAATACKSGTYLVVNASGASMGWCVAASYCKDGGTKLNIIDGTKTDLKCVSASTGAVVSEPDNVETPNPDNNENGATADMQTQQSTQTPCEQGMAGYVIYAGKCMTNAEMQAILDAAAAVQAARRQQEISQSTQRIRDAHQNIESLSGSLKKTVWKDADGNFNTARLVSDSVAGVVLGTAGGLITSSVVKKNQVKNGFENLKCTIGGQMVAGWGDAFHVGIK